jgi:hypothetical protein
MKLQCIKIIAWYSFKLIFCRTPDDSHIDHVRISIVLLNQQMNLLFQIKCKYMLNQYHVH